MKRLHSLFLRNPWHRLPLFALLVLVPFAAGECYVRSLPNPAKSKHAYLSRHSGEVEVLVLGSSHTFYGICPELLGRHAFSAAQVSQTWRYDNWLLYHYPFPRLRAVVLPVSDFSFYENLEGGNEWYLANRYRLYMDCDIHPRGSVYDWEITAFPVFCEKLKSLWQPPKLTWSATGQGLNYTKAARPENWDNGLARARSNIYRDFSAAPEMEGYLRSIADYCRKKGVRLLLVTTPLSKSYRENQDVVQGMDTRRRLDRFLREYPETYYVNFRDDPAFGAEDFYDADHLNLDGAKKLSRSLRRYLSGI